jgi:hypothetical protein
MTLIKLRKPGTKEKKISLLIYGPNRVGKSTLAGSAAELFPTLFLECDEGGSDSLTNLHYQPDVTRVKELKKLNDIFWGLKSGELVSSSGDPFQVVVFDGIGELMKRALDVILSKKVLKVDLNSDQPPVLRDWGLATAQMRKVVRYFSDLPLHLIYTTVEKQINTKEGNPVRIGPSMSPSLSEDVCNASKIIGYMTGRGGKNGYHRFLIAGPYDLDGIPVVSGHRIGLNSEFSYWKDPTFKSIYDTVRKGGVR